MFKDDDDDNDDDGYDDGNMVNQAKLNLKIVFSPNLLTVLY